MRSLALLILVAVVGSACDVDLDTGARFRAERDLYRANWEYEKLAVRPQLATDEMWRGLAAKFEAVADRVSPSPGTDGAAREADIVAARALFTAAQINGTVRDTVRAEEIFARMQRDYAGISEVWAPVSMAQGAMSERRGLYDQAIERYQPVVDAVEPVPDDPGVAGMVLELPLRIARLRAREATPATRGEYYAPARRYYGDILERDPDPLLQLRARALLADVATDLEEWGEAADHLSAVEDALRGATSPGRDPAVVRFQLAQLKQRSGAAGVDVEAVLHSLIDDYPESPVVPQALFTLARTAAERGAAEEALAHLDTIRKDHTENEAFAAQALLVRARLLEADDARWSEALEAYRELTLVYPISEGALLAPLEVAGHYGRVNDEAAKDDALARATREYREFIGRYPPGPHTLKARERLAQSLALQKDYSQAISEMERVGESAVGSPQGAAALVAAAGIAYNDLADTTRALSILDRVSETYAQVDVGQWAEREAKRIREAGTP